MMPWFDVLYPAAMIVAPALLAALWGHWTGVRGAGRALVAALVLLLLFGTSGFVLGPEAVAHPLHKQGWAVGGFLVVMLGFFLPVVMRAAASLPEPPKAASLRPRQLELFPGAWVWPFAAWAVLAALVLLRGGTLVWLGPLLGLASLVLLRFVLPLTVLEPEPLGGEDPEDLARRYETFRRRRVRGMYWLFVLLALAVTGGWRFLADVEAGWAGALVGATLGLFGALFGVWADAQRYLLRRQLAGLRPGMNESG